MTDIPKTVQTQLHPYFSVGGIFDVNTYRGNVRAIGVWFVWALVVWHFDQLYSLAYHLLGVEYEIDVSKEKWAQVCAAAMGIGGLAVHAFACVSIFLRRGRDASKDD